MLTPGGVRPVGALCALVLFAAGCAARTEAQFPGAPGNTAAAPKQPPPVFTPATASYLAGFRAPRADRHGPVFDVPVQSPVLFAAWRLYAAQWPVPVEQIYEPPSAPAPVAGDTAAAGDLAGGLITPGVDVPLDNVRVQSFVRLLSGRLRPFLEEGLGRGVQFLPMVQSVFRAEGLPVELAYVPLVESAFKPTALSRAKARGIWQFMRGTGLENGLTHDWYIDERADPEKATRAAAKYLKTLYNTFDGDWHLALAAYNGGPGRVQRAIRRSGRDDFWRISASSQYLPRETRDYVPLVLAAIVIARNPLEYGLAVTPVTPPRFETVTLPAPADLRRIAGWIGTPVDDLRSLNPELRQWTTPLRAEGYELKVPDGTGDILRAHFERTDPLRLTTISWHAVKKGDTLASVAKKLKVTRAELAEANYLSTSARLSVGQQLLIPRAPALPEVDLAVNSDAPAPVAAAALPLPAAADAASAPGASSVAAVALEAPAAGAPAVGSALRAAASEYAGPVSRSRPGEGGPAPRIYRVQRGDTLFSIARQHETTVASLQALNRLRGTAIKVGQRLTVSDAPGAESDAAPESILASAAPIPSPRRTEASVVAAADAPPARRIHRVRRGDTLFSIARLYRTTVEAIKRWNRLNTDSIQVGQRLAILSQRAATATN